MAKPSPRISDHPAVRLALIANKQQKTAAMMMVRSCVFVAALMLVVGCGSAGKTVPVSGAITLDGKPLANAHVVFQPEAAKGNSNPGIGSFAFTGPDGRYTLRTFDTEQPGAVVGTHRVEINLKVESDDRPNAGRPPPKMLPAKYNRQSELQFKVEPGGSSAANFDLKSQ
jgi:hypothetical protein